MVTLVYTFASADVEPGTVLFEEGTAGGGIVVLLAGRLIVTKKGHTVGQITEPGCTSASQPL